MRVSLIIKSGEKSYSIGDIASGSINIKSSMAMAPTSLKFDVIRDMAESGIEFYEGDRVSLSVNDTNLFTGYIYTKIRSRDNIISVTCYDQLRYLKNKDTYIYYNKKASDIVKMIALDFKLELGVIEDSGYIIPQRIENNQELIDIINNAILATYQNTGKRMVLYDEGGKLAFKNSVSLRLPYMLTRDDTGLVNYSYKSDINEDTYNKVKLYKKDDRKSLFESYVFGDSVNQQKWGVLQYYKKIDTNLSFGQLSDIAQQILKEKNRVKRSLGIECLLLEGEENIRAGNSVFVKIEDLGDTSINDWLIIEGCEHIIKNNEHRVKLSFSEI